MTSKPIFTPIITPIGTQVRTLKAQWNVGTNIKSSPPTVPMTKEEEADEIIRRLATPPERGGTTSEDDILWDELCIEIAKEVDDAILDKLIKITHGHTRI